MTEDNVGRVFLPYLSSAMKSKLRRAGIRYRTQTLQTGYPGVRVNSAHSPSQIAETLGLLVDEILSHRENDTDILILRRSEQKALRNLDSPKWVFEDTEYRSEMTLLVEQYLQPVVRVPIKLECREGSPILVNPLEISEADFRIVLWGGAVSATRSSESVSLYGYDYDNLSPFHHSGYGVPIDRDGVELAELLGERVLLVHWPLGPDREDLPMFKDILIQAANLLFDKESFEKRLKSLPAVPESANEEMFVQMCLAAYDERVAALGNEAQSAERNAYQMTRVTGDCLRDADTCGALSAVIRRSPETELDTETSSVLDSVCRGIETGSRLSSFEGFLSLLSLPIEAETEELVESLFSPSAMRSSLEGFRSLLDERQEVARTRKTVVLQSLETTRAARLAAATDFATKTESAGRALYDAELAQWRAVSGEERASFMEHCRHEYTLLRNLAGVKRIYIPDTSVILLHTYPIWSWNSATNSIHELGEFRIELYAAREFGVLLFNLGGTRHGYQAPHVPGEATPCLGDLTDTLFGHLRRREFFNAGLTAIRFLVDCVNPTDPWGKFIEHWPFYGEELWDERYADGVEKGEVHPFRLPHGMWKYLKMRRENDESYVSRLLDAKEKLST